MQVRQDNAFQPVPLMLTEFEKSSVTKAFQYAIDAESVVGSVMDMGFGEAAVVKRLCDPNRALTDLSI